MRAPIFALGLVVLGLVLAGPVRAQSSAEARERAVTLFAQSVTAYREGRFDAAAALLDEAYALQPEPVLLYNLGRAREGAGDDEAAADAYRRYLATEGTDATDASAARARLAVLDRRIEEHRALEARATQREAELGATDTHEPAPPPSASAPEPARSIALAPWVIAGVGVLVIGAGAVFGGLMLDRSATAQAAPIQADAAAAQAQAETFAIAADVLFGVGALAALVGVVWGIVDLASPTAEGASAQLRLGPTGLALEGTW